MEEGFYRVENNTLVGPVLNIINQSYTLTYGDPYPSVIDGWYIFTNKQDAYLFFGLDYLDYIKEDLTEVSLYVDEIKTSSIDLTKSYILSGSTISQEQYNDLLMIYPFFKTNHPYLVDDIFQYYGKLYKVIQGHTSQDNWIPSELPALYIIVQPEGVIAPWVQPLGSEDSYSLGDKVTHNGFTWESTTDNNVWEPGIFGWVQI